MAWATCTQTEANHLCEAASNAWPSSIRALPRSKKYGFVPHTQQIYLKLVCESPRGSLLHTHTNLMLDTLGLQASRCATSSPHSTRAQQRETERDRERQRETERDKERQREITCTKRQSTHDPPRCAQGRSVPPRALGPSPAPVCTRKTEFFIENLLVRVHYIIMLILVDRPCAMGV